MTFPSVFPVHQDSPFGFPVVNGYSDIVAEVPVTAGLRPQLRLLLGVIVGVRQGGLRLLLTSVLGARRLGTHDAPGSGMFEYQYA